LTTLEASRNTETGTAVVIIRDGILVEERVDDPSQPALAPMASSPK
jgi:hypothetical protein